MATITVKNFPDLLYKKLKKSAQIHRRSINSEVVVCIERALKSHRISPEEVLERARPLRKRIAGHLFTEEEIAEAKAIGRP